MGAKSMNWMDIPGDKLCEPVISMVRVYIKENLVSDCLSIIHTRTTSKIIVKFPG